MSNYFEAKKELSLYIKARTPLVIVESQERERVERMLSEIAYEEKINIDYYTDSKQVIVFGNGSSQKDANRDPLFYGFEKFKRSKRGCFAIGDVTKLDSDNAYSREFLNLLYSAKETSSVVVIITADNVWHRLSVLGAKVELEFPDQKEIVSTINRFIKDNKHSFDINWTEKDVITASTLLRGLSEIQLMNALSAELIAHGGLYSKNIGTLARHKDRLYGSVGAISKINISENIRVSGMDNLKQWLQGTKEVFFADEELLKYYQIKAPKGILLSGVPGCGKSFCAKMVAKEWGLPLYRFDISSLFDKWMGESERKMREALTFIDSVSPCVLWIDEIEKMLSTTDSSNDTGNRILGQFLFWLQESDSRVFLVATANNVQTLPPELFRKGRFSEIFFADLPTDSERREAITQYLEASLHVCFNEDEISQLVNETDGYSYADIEIAIKNVSRMLVRDRNMIIDVKTVLNEIKAIVPFLKSNPELVEQCRAWGSDKAISVSIKKEGTINE